MTPKQQLAQDLLRMSKQYPGLFGPAVEELAQSVDKLGSFEAVERDSRDRAERLRAEADKIEQGVKVKVEEARKVLDAAKAEAAKHLDVVKISAEAHLAHTKTLAEEYHAATSSAANTLLLNAKAEAERIAAGVENEVTAKRNAIAALTSRLADLDSQVTAKSKALEEIESHLNVLRSKIGA